MNMKFINFHFIFYNEFLDEIINKITVNIILAVLLQKAKIAIVLKSLIRGGERAVSCYSSRKTSMGAKMK